MVDLGGYVIILVETKEKKVKLYGSPADKADLEVADEILEINGESLENSSHTDVISHIHNCIKSRTICLRVKRRSGNKLAKELAESSHVQDAFVIAVEQQAKERLERLSALRKIKPVDMTKLSQQLCDSPPSEHDQPNTIYSAPVSELGSTANLNKVTSSSSSQSNNHKNNYNKRTTASNNNHPNACPSSVVTEEAPNIPNPSSSSPKKPLALSSSPIPLNTNASSYSAGAIPSSKPVSDANNKTTLKKVDSLGDETDGVVGSGGGGGGGSCGGGSTGGGYVTDEELELTQTIEAVPPPKRYETELLQKADDIQSPSKEVLIADDSSRRSSRSSIFNNGSNGLSLPNKNGNDHNGGTGSNNHRSESRKTSIRNGQQHLKIAEEEAKIGETIKRKVRHKPLGQTMSLKTVVDANEMLTIVDRVLRDPKLVPDNLTQLSGLIRHTQFQRLLTIHNTIQCVQCFQCPPRALCSNIQELVRECLVALQSSVLPEAAEILQILQQIEFEELFFCHDKLAQRQGATVRNEGDKVVIGRVVKGGAAERSGQLHAGDEVLEVNGLKLKGKSVHDICDTLCQMTGTLTFVIVPNSDEVEPSGGAPTLPKESNGSIMGPNAMEMIPQGASACLSVPPEEVLHYRAHFNYNPDDDLYIPCHELGISFQRGDILHVINREDLNWWQAYRDGEWTQTLAGLIPSLALQQHRMALQRQKREQDLKEQRELERNSPAKKKGGLGRATSGSAASLLCARKSNKRKKMGSPFKKAEKYEVPPYEEMALYYPQANQRRPLILVGPPNIGRHELRLRLLEDINRFAAAVPHTSRAKGEGEIDGQDYNFVSRTQFEEYVGSKRFVEHGEFDKQYYGTSLDAVRTVINSGKICVLNLQPGSLQILHDSDLKPYVVFLTPPSLQTYRQQRLKYGEPVKEEEYRDSITFAQDMEEQYGQYFDSVIPFDNVDYVFEQLLYEINLLEREPQVPNKANLGQLGKIELFKVDEENMPSSSNRPMQIRFSL
eukprot:TCALIF_11987-PA protein Name:"Similar to Mpp5 MAGUK p55 subfamily member 5 (Mus musculus)" AED:0.13 eAED:0.13 QI:345/0.87/0.88/0.94/0.87/0.88/17/0/1002